MAYITEETNRRFCHYDSVSQVMDAEISNTENRDHYQETLHESRDRGWFGDESHIRTGEQAIKVVNHGWPEGLERATRELDKIELPRLPSMRRKRMRGPDGDSLDIHRVNNGDLDRAWHTTKREPRLVHAGGKITLAVNYTVSAKQLPDEIFWRGALVAFLTDALERTGRRVQIVAHDHVYHFTEKLNSSYELCNSITVKHFHQPMTLDKIMSTCAYIGFSRTIGFKAILLQPEVCRYSLGKVMRDSKLLPKVIQDERPILIGDDVTSLRAMKRAQQNILAPFGA